MNLDELQKQIELDEIADGEYATPIQFAKTKGIAPQRIYYLIRSGKLASERCKCGRLVVAIRAAEEALSQSSRTRNRDLARLDSVFNAGSDSEGSGDLVQELSQTETVEEAGDTV